MKSKSLKIIHINILILLSAIIFFLFVEDIEREFYQMSVLFDCRSHKKKSTITRQISSGQWKKWCQHNLFLSKPSFYHSQYVHFIKICTTIWFIVEFRRKRKVKNMNKISQSFVIIIKRYCKLNIQKDIENNVKEI